MNTAVTSRQESPDIGRSDELPLLSFKPGNEEFGVDILQVQEINLMSEITKVPQAPSSVEGVINLRGKVIPIIDLRKRLNLEPKGYDRDTRIVVVNVSGNVTGMIVDAVSEVLRLAADTIEPPPELVGGVNSEYIKGVAKLDDRLLIQLDPSMVVDISETADIKLYSGYYTARTGTGPAGRFFCGINFIGRGNEKTASVTVAVGVYTAHCGPYILTRSSASAVQPPQKRRYHSRQDQLSVHQYWARASFLS
jgi:purine-binding chemotaxis protein CheW